MLTGFVLSAFYGYTSQSQKFSWYKQEEISHFRSLSTANGYLRMLLFISFDLTTVEKTKLSRLVSQIVSVNLPSFLMTHLKPHACEGLFVTLFQRDLLLAFEAVDSDECKVVNRYFFQHAKSWLLPPNITLSVYSENPPMTKKVFTSLTSLPEEVAIKDLLLTRRAKLRNFLPFPVKPHHASRLAQPNFENLWKIIIAAMKEK